MITPGNGRIFIYETTSSLGFTPITEIKLNGKMVGTAAPGRFFFGDQPPGDYAVTALVPEASGFGSFAGHMQAQDAPATEHTVTFHVNAGQVRYVRLDVRTSPIFVTQVYPELVGVKVGRAQIEDRIHLERASNGFGHIPWWNRGTAVDLRVFAQRCAYKDHKYLQSPG